MHATLLKCIRTEWALVWLFGGWDRWKPPKPFMDTSVSEVASSKQYSLCVKRLLHARHRLPQILLFSGTMEAYTPTSEPWSQEV
jgi:hypothetical protein